MHVNWAEIGNQNIRIDVKTLLQRLRPDDDDPTSWPPFRFRRKRGLDRIVEEPAVLRREAAVVQGRAVGDL